MRTIETSKEIFRVERAARGLYKIFTKTGDCFIFEATVATPRKSSSRAAILQAIGESRGDCDGWL